MNLVLTGMKHCGKSTIGRILADRWGCPFYDVDPMIEAVYSCETGRELPVREIFGRHGEEYFHRIEGQVVCDLYLRLSTPGSSAVVALGGRTATNPVISELLGAIGLIVHLKVDPEVLFERVARAGLPPFLDEQDPAGDFAALCRKREPYYERLASIIVDVNGLAPDAAADLVERRIRERTHGR